MIALTLLFSAVAGGAEARSFIPEARAGGKLLLTGGVSSIEGSGGGGIATWATVTGHGDAVYDQTAGFLAKLAPMRRDIVTR